MLGVNTGAISEQHCRLVVLASLVLVEGPSSESKIIWLLRVPLGGIEN